MSLSLSTTSRRMSSITPAWFSASKAMPPVSAESPITAMAWRASPRSFAAMAMPSAAEIEVDECAVPKASYSDSSRRGKPEMPPAWRSKAIASRRPVRILCA